MTPSPNRQLSDQNKTVDQWLSKHLTNNNHTHSCRQMRDLDRQIDSRWPVRPLAAGSAVLSFGKKKNNFATRICVKGCCPLERNAYCDKTDFCYIISIGPWLDAETTVERWNVILLLWRTWGYTKLSRNNIFSKSIYFYEILYQFDNLIILYNFNLDHHTLFIFWNFSTVNNIYPCFLKNGD